MKAGKLIRKVIQARTDAAVLHHKMKHMRLLAERLARVLQEKERDKTLKQDRNFQETVAAIGEELKQCLVCLQIIEEELDPLDVLGTQHRPPSFGKRIKFVTSQSYIKTQQSAIDAQLAILSLNYDMLRDFGQSATRNEVRETRNALRDLTRVLTRNASDQQVNVSNLERPESDQDPPSPVNDPTSDEDDPEPELTRYCPGCQRLNTIIPDTPLAFAVKHRQAKLIPKLIANGHDLTIIDANKWTLLHHAADQLDQPATHHILEAESSPDFVDAKTSEGLTALMYVAGQAGINGSYETAAELISKRCDVNLKDDSEDKRTALWFAVNGSAEGQRKRLVDLLVNSGAVTAPILDGSMKEKAKAYSSILDAAQNEQPPEKEGLMRRLSKVVTNEARPKLTS